MAETCDNVNDTNLVLSTDPKDACLFVVKSSNSSHHYGSGSDDSPSMLPPIADVDSAAVLSSMATTKIEVVVNGVKRVVTVPLLTSDDNSTPRTSAPSQMDSSKNACRPVIRAAIDRRMLLPRTTSNGCMSTDRYQLRTPTSSTACSTPQAQAPGRFPVARPLQSSINFQSNCAPGSVGGASFAGNVTNAVARQPVCNSFTTYQISSVLENVSGQVMANSKGGNNIPMMSFPGTNSAGCALRQMASLNQAPFSYSNQMGSFTGQQQQAVYISQARSSYGQLQTLAPTFNQSVVPSVNTMMSSPAYGNIISTSYGQVVPVAIHLPVCQSMAINAPFQANSQLQVLNAPTAATLSLSNGYVCGSRSNPPPPSSSSQFNQFNLASRPTFTTPDQVPVVRPGSSSNHFVGRFRYKSRILTQNGRGGTTQSVRERLQTPSDLPVSINSDASQSTPSVSGAAHLQKLLEQQVEQQQQQKFVIGQEQASKANNVQQSAQSANIFSQFQLIAPRTTAVQMLVGVPVIQTSPSSTVLNTTVVSGQKPVTSLPSNETVRSIGASTSSVDVILSATTNTWNAVSCASGPSLTNGPRLGASGDAAADNSRIADALCFSPADLASRESDSLILELDKMLHGPSQASEGSSTVTALSSSTLSANCDDNVNNGGGLAFVNKAASPNASSGYSREQMKKALQTARSIGKGMHHEAEKARNKRQSRRRRKQRLTSLDYNSDDSSSSGSSDASWRPDEVMPSCLDEFNEAANWSTDDDDSEKEKSTKKKKKLALKQLSQLRHSASQREKSQKYKENANIAEEQILGSREGRVLTRRHKNGTDVTFDYDTYRMLMQSAKRSSYVLLEKLNLGDEHAINVRNRAKYLCCLQYKNAPSRSKRIIDSDCSDTDCFSSDAAAAAAAAAATAAAAAAAGVTVKTKSRRRCIVDSDDS